MEQVGTAMSVFGNTPWCAAEGRPALCVGPDADLPKSPDVYWSDCRSLSCQFDLQPSFCGGTTDGAGAPCSLNSAGDGCSVDTGDCVFVPDNGRAYMRPLFDSSFFLGWLWSVTVFGFISDRFGRRTALYGAVSVFIVAHVAGALAPSARAYLVLRHFMGVGIGSTAITAYVLGSELSPRKRAPMVKVFFATFGALGTSLAALVLRPMLYIPGYNWRVLGLLSIIPTVFFAILAACTIDESPRWVLITRGEMEAKVLLRKIALRNDPTGKYLPVLDAIKLRIPKKVKSFEKACENAHSSGQCHTDLLRQHQLSSRGFLVWLCSVPHSLRRPALSYGRAAVANGGHLLALVFLGVFPVPPPPIISRDHGSVSYCISALF